MNASAPELNIVILAAGVSARLGTPKALVKVHGVSLLRRTLEICRSLAPAEILVLVPPRCNGYRLHARGIPATFLENAGRLEGLASSVRLGVRHARFAAGILLLPVDLVDLTRRDLHRLLARWRSMPGRVVATRLGSHGGIPLILPARLFPAAGQLCGDVGLRALLTRLPARECELVQLPSATFDVDTPAELASARRRWRAAPP